MTILGLSFGYHDAAATLIKDGDILWAAHSERYSKKKHDPFLNSLMIKDMLDYGTPIKFAYYERPLFKKLREIYAGQSELFNWKLMNVKQEIKTHFTSDIRINKLYKFNHHLSHAAAGFQTSPFNDATVVVIDAIGEFDTISIWNALYDKKGNAQYKKIWSRYYPNSIGLFYSAATKFVGLKPLDDEYILMGMASYGEPINHREFRDSYLMSDTKNLRFKENLHLGFIFNKWPIETQNFDSSEEVYFNIAATVQTITEELINTVISIAREKGKSKNLVYMGGVALNCLANRHLGNYFDNIWIMPNPGDAGSSLGCAALVYGKKLNWKGAYLGKNIPGVYPSDNLINALVEHKIVGVASGRAEFGPRALGNRSLLADPRGFDIKDKVNAIKRRQKFRPFAPVILEEQVHDYFIMPNGWSRSDYMQVVARCKYPHLFPAIVHADGTSRVQTVSKDCQSGIRELLEKWYLLTGCPMLLNTSLNIRGEPMVNTREDADRFELLYGISVYS